MTAKEMFSELGYEKIEDNTKIEYYRGENENYIVIRFWKKSKYIELFGEKNIEFELDNYKYFDHDYKLFKAINKQIEELGWNK